MNAELLYTSAPEGLKRGSRGFCTVVATEGLPVNVSQRLESLSGYRHVFQPGEDRDADNPICHSHLRFTVGGRLLHVVSRIAAYGVDYSQRTNKIAHHIVVDRPPPGGPVPLLQSDAFLRSWDGVCRTKSQGPSLQGSAIAASICHRWETVTGDAGWGGLLAAAWASSASKPLWIVFELSQSKELLALIGESIALLPESARWDATFSTYYTNLPPDVECRVRCVLSGSDEARMAAARGAVIQLKKNQAEPPKSSWVEAARTGNYPSPSAAVPTIDPQELHGGVAQSESSALLRAPSDPPADDQLEYELMGVPSASPPPTKVNARNPIRHHSAEFDDLPPPVRRSKGWLIASIAVALFVLLGSSAALFYWQYQNNQRIADALELPEEIQEDTKVETRPTTTETERENDLSVATRADQSDLEPLEEVLDSPVNAETEDRGKSPKIDSEKQLENATKTTEKKPPAEELPADTQLRIRFKQYPCPWYPDTVCVAPGTTFTVSTDENQENLGEIQWTLEYASNPQAQGGDVHPVKKTAKGMSYTLPDNTTGTVVAITIESNKTPIATTLPKVRILEPIQTNIRTRSIIDKENITTNDLHVSFKLKAPLGMQEIFAQRKNSEKSFLSDQSFTFGDAFQEGDDNRIEQLLEKIGDSNKRILKASDAIEKANTDIRRKMTGFVSPLVMSALSRNRIDSRSEVDRLNEDFRHLEELVQRAKITGDQLDINNAKGSYGTITGIAFANNETVLVEVGKIVKLWNEDIRYEIDKIEQAVDSISEEANAKEELILQLNATIKEFGPKEMLLFKMLSRPSKKTADEIPSKPQFLSFAYPIRIEFPK